MNNAWLIAIDGSTPSLNAVDHVIREAANCQVKPQVYLINVQPALSSDITRFIEERVVQDYHREAGDTALAAAKEKMESSGLAFTPHILIGEAAPTIVKFAQDKECSKIVMGAHGFGSVVGLFMGSVTVKVVHQAAVPVLLVK